MGEIAANVIQLVRNDKYDEFWLLYPSPRRVGKAVCKAKWDAITGPTGLHTTAKDPSTGGFIPIFLSATPEEIIEGLKRCCEKWKAKTGSYGWIDDGKYIPMPVTWLNQGRWLD